MSLGSTEDDMLSKEFIEKQESTTVVAQEDNKLTDNTCNTDMYPNLTEIILIGSARTSSHSSNVRCP